MDIADIMFFIKSLKNPTDNFNILDYVSFSNNPIRSSSSIFSHQTTNLESPVSGTAPVSTIKHEIKIFMWNHFTAHFDQDDTCSFSFLYPCQKCYNASLSINHNQL